MLSGPIKAAIPESECVRGSQPPFSRYQNITVPPFKEWAGLNKEGGKLRELIIKYLNWTMIPFLQC